MNAFAPLAVTVVIASACLAACGGPRSLDKALADEKGKTPVAQGNSQRFDAPMELTLRVVAGTLVQKGFAIEQADSSMGFIKASRKMPDPKNENVNYHISATAYVSAQQGGRASLVTLSASQETVLHRSGHSWTTVPFIIPIPIPTGKTYETVVTGEGGLKAETFYRDFFTAVQQGLASASEFGAPTLALGSPKAGTAATPPAQPPESGNDESANDVRKQTAESGLTTTPPSPEPTPHL